MWCDWVLIVRFTFSKPRNASAIWSVVLLLNSCIFYREVSNTVVKVVSQRSLPSVVTERRAHIPFPVAFTFWVASHKWHFKILAPAAWGNVFLQDGILHIMKTLTLSTNLNSFNSISFLVSYRSFFFYFIQLQVCFFDCCCWCGSK